MTAGYEYGAMQLALARTLGWELYPGISFPGIYALLLSPGAIAFSLVACRRADL